MHHLWFSDKTCIVKCVWKNNSRRSVIINLSSLNLVWEEYALRSKSKAVINENLVLEDASIKHMYERVVFELICFIVQGTFSQHYWANWNRGSLCPGWPSYICGICKLRPSQRKENHK